MEAASIQIKAIFYPGNTHISQVDERPSSQTIPLRTLGYPQLRKVLFG